MALAPACYQLKVHYLPENMMVATACRRYLRTEEGDQDAHCVTSITSPNWLLFPDAEKKVRKQQLKILSVYRLKSESERKSFTLRKQKVTAYFEVIKAVVFYWQRQAQSEAINHTRRRMSTPCPKLVKYEVQNTRVGQMTDYDKLILEVNTDGRITPEDAHCYPSCNLRVTIWMFLTKSVKSRLNSKASRKKLAKSKTTTFVTCSV